MKEWLGQATTGAGFATIFAGLGALGTGALNWQQAIPVLAGGIASLIWPENSGARAAAQQLAVDVNKLIAVYRSVSPSQRQASEITTQQANTKMQSGGAN